MKKKGASLFAIDADDLDDRDMPCCIPLLREVLHSLLMGASALIASRETLNSYCVSYLVSTFFGKNNTSSKSQYRRINFNEEVERESDILYRCR